MNELAIRNINLLLAVTLALGFMQGLFELMFPFYLEFREISLVGMGVLYTITYCDDEFIQIFVGDYSDSVGRKKTYTMSFILGGIANILFSFGRGVIDLSIIKDLNDIATTIRGAVSSPMIFENVGNAFTRYIAYFRGGGLVIQATGYFAAFIILQYLGFFGCFYTIALTNFIAFAFFTLYYKEGILEKEGKPNQNFNQKEA